MRTLSSLLFIGIAALGLVAALPVPSHAEQTYYGTVALVNDTGYTINYQRRWGDGTWETITLRPGEYCVHSFKYEYPGQNRSPVPEVRFDIGGGKATRQYSLEAFAAPDTSLGRSKQYVFRYQGQYLDLSAR